MLSKKEINQLKQLLQIKDSKVMDLERRILELEREFREKLMNEQREKQSLSRQLEVEKTKNRPEGTVDVKVASVRTNEARRLSREDGASKEDHAGELSPGGGEYSSRGDQKGTPGRDFKIQRKLPRVKYEDVQRVGLIVSMRLKNKRIDLADIEKVRGSVSGSL